MNEKGQTTSKLLTANVKAGGCAAKMSAAELFQILSDLPDWQCPELLTGMAGFEDAAVYKLNGDLAVVQTIDFFPPLVDDPFLFGQIAATNALSDVYAMGGRPILALSVLCFPTCDFPIEVVRDIVRGGAHQVKAAGAVLAGGHSIQSPEPIYGLSVMGLIHPDKILTNGGAHDGDAIVLCKAIGTGVALLGLKAELLEGEDKQALWQSLTRLNDTALAAALAYEISAATDVTGFGLIGHLHEMAQASGLQARLWAQQVPLLPQALALANQGFVPAGAYGNRNSFEKYSYINEVDLALTDLFFDPQTSGGLLLALPAGSAAALVQDLKALGLSAAQIGRFEKGTAGMVEVENK